MEHLLQPLIDSVRRMQADAAVIAEDYRAMNAMSDDIVAVTESKEPSHA